MVGLVCSPLRRAGMLGRIQLSVRGLTDLTLCLFGTGSRAAGVTAFILTLRALAVTPFVNFLRHRRRSAAAVGLGMVGLVCSPLRRAGMLGRIQLPVKDLTDLALRFCGTGSRTAGVTAFILTLRALAVAPFVNFLRHHRRSAATVGLGVMGLVRSPLRRSSMIGSIQIPIKRLTNLANCLCSTGSRTAGVTAFILTLHALAVAPLMGLFRYCHCAAAAIRRAVVQCGLRPFHSSGVITGIQRQFQIHQNSGAFAVGIVLFAAVAAPVLRCALNAAGRRLLGVMRRIVSQLAKLLRFRSGSGFLICLEILPTCVTLVIQVVTLGIAGRLVRLVFICSCMAAGHRHIAHSTDISHCCRNLRCSRRDRSNFAVAVHGSNVGVAAGPPQIVCGILRQDLRSQISFLSAGNIQRQRILAQFYFCSGDQHIHLRRCAVGQQLGLRYNLD